MLFSLGNERLNLKIIGLDNSDYELKNTQLDYLRGQLAKEVTSTFLAMHIPPMTNKWGWTYLQQGSRGAGKNRLSQ